MPRPAVGIWIAARPTPGHDLRRLHSSSLKSRRARFPNCHGYAWIHSNAAHQEHDERADLVYVDNAFVESRGRQWCHLLAETVDELHAFAAEIGLSKHAFHRAARIPHYDVTALQRQLVLARGVQPVTVREAILLTRHLAVAKSRPRRLPARQHELFA